MSPQILLKDYNSYKSKTDIWSLGVIFYEILFGKQPWNCTSIDELEKKVKETLTFPEFPAVS